VEDSLAPLYRPLHGQNLPIFHIFHDLLLRWQVGFPPCYASKRFIHQAGKAWGVV
jgi:hypothetical protein